MNKTQALLSILVVGLTMLILVETVVADPGRYKTSVRTGSKSVRVTKVRYKNGVKEVDIHWDETIEADKTVTHETPDINEALGGKIATAVIVYGFVDPEGASVPMNGQHPPDGKWHSRGVFPYNYSVRTEHLSAVGGIWVPVDKLGLLAPYIGLASTLIVATVATAIYVKRVKHRREKQ